MQHINSSEYWDGRFSQDWESREGPQQSRFFARIAIESLPRWVLQRINAENLSIADWGCAQGDGTDVLANYFHSEQITGIDFSEIAVHQATERYPSIRFACQNWLDNESYSEAFDIVFSSNTLEHFHSPYDVLERLADRTRNAIILALPYREIDRIEEHFYTFLPENVPIRLSNGFRLIWSRIVDCRKRPGAMWGGDQVVLVYGNCEWLDRIGLKLADFHLEQDDTSSEIDSLRAVISTRETEITVLRQAIAKQNLSIDELAAEVNKQVANAQGFARQVALQDEHAQSLARDVAERDAQAQHFASEVVARDLRIQGLEQQLTNPDAQTRDLHILLQDSESKFRDLEQKLAKRDDQTESLRALLRACESRFQDLDQKFVSRDDQAESLRALLSACELRFQDLEKTQATRDDQTESLRTLLADHELQRQKLEQELNACNEQASSFVHQLSELDASGQLFAKDLASSQKRIDDFMDQMQRKNRMLILLRPMHWLKNLHKILFKSP